MAEPMESLSSDEFEIIEGAEDSLNEMNDNHVWSMQQSIRLEPMSFKLPSELPISPIENQPVSETTLDRKDDTLKSFGLSLAETQNEPSITKETPILADSMNSDAETTPVGSLVNETCEPTIQDVSLINCSISSNSTLNSSSVENTEKALRSSLVYVQELKRQMSAQAAKIAELEQREAIEKELIKLEQSTLVQSKEMAQRKHEEQQKSFEEELKLLSLQFERKHTETRSHYMDEMTTQAAIITELRSKLSSLNETAEKSESLKAENQESRKLVEEVKSLREQLDWQIARTLEESDLRKVFERQVNNSGRLSYLDPSANVIASQLANKTEYCVRLEDEIERLRDELTLTRDSLKIKSDEASNALEIVNVLKEDQLESVREIKAKQDEIDNLTRVCRRNGIIDDNLY